MNEVNNAGRKSRMSIILMLMIFVAPMLAAWVVYHYFPDTVRKLGSSNYGTLINPPVKLPINGLSDIEGNPIAGDILDKKWTYVYFNSGECDRACFDHLMLMKNVRLSQGKEISRMKRLFVVTAGTVDASLQQTLAQFPALRTVVLNSEAQRNQLRAALETTGDPDPLNSGAIYVVDPDAKAMMYYKQEKQVQQAQQGLGEKAILKLAKGMQGDMAKLMKNSKLRK